MSAPVRIDLAGGPTDLPALREDQEGAVLNAAISLRVRTAVHRTGLFRRLDAGMPTTFRCHVSPLDDSFLPLEPVNALVRAAADAAALAEQRLSVEVSSQAPLGAGLGTSSSLMVSALAAIELALYGQVPERTELFETAVRTESGLSGEAEGGQDHYAAVHGGINLLRFNENGLHAVPVVIPPPLQKEYLSRLSLFVVSHGRRSSDIITSTVERYRSGDRDTVSAVRGLPALARGLAESLAANDLDGFSAQFSEVARLEEMLSPYRFPRDMSEARDHLRKGLSRTFIKSPGAGGGGCLLVHAPPDQQRQVRMRARSLGLLRLPLSFESKGLRFFQDTLTEEQH
ncbi:hypothetical protein ACGF3G_50385 [Streptomyces sp. NPDC048179]|uniref:GHMP family kinase ATP-binding protein n=1 Tax=Streptomyces sp. NPDC048179 TaxID=3365506 RepID=UPI0037233DB0